MTRAPLHIVGSEPTPIGLGDRIRAHRDETSALAAEHVAELVDAIRAVERLSGEIAGLASAYPPGVVDLARRIADDLGPRALTLATLMERAR